MRADLHVHSTASDGTVAPRDLVRMALERNLDVLAIADHDSVSGVEEAIEAASGTTLTLIPAIEFSSAQGEDHVHVLAYHVDHRSPALLEELDLLRQDRERRAYEMVSALREAGFDVSMDQVLAFSDGGSVGRSHVARALVDAGYADDIGTAFQRYIGRDAEFYRAKRTRTPAEVVASVRAAGAVPVVAHPGVSQVDELIPEMVAAGLLGIEAFHADHSVQQREYYAEMASRLGLIATGGTDYHGPQAHNPEVGSVDVPEEGVRALLRLSPGQVGGTA